MQRITFILDVINNLTALIYIYIHTQYIVDSVQGFELFIEELIPSQLFSLECKYLTLAPPLCLFNSKMFQSCETVKLLVEGLDGRLFRSLC